MTKEATPIDINDQPEIMRLAQEVQASRQPRLLRCDNEDIAILTPASTRRRRTKGRPLTRKDSLFNIIGIFGMAPSSEGEPADISSKKHQYLAEAYSKHGR